MPNRNVFKRIDKIAAIFLGVPALMGALSIVLALYSPGSAPNRNAPVAIAAGIVLLALGAMGGGGYMRWRKKKQPDLGIGGGAGGVSSGKTPRHSVVFTPPAADKVRRIFANNREKLKYVLVCVVQKPSGDFTIDLSSDQGLRQSPRHAFAVSNGINVVIDRTNLERFADLVVDYHDGMFDFRGSAAPTKALASDPGRIDLSAEKLAVLCPEARKDKDLVDRVAWFLKKGDSRPAVVMSVSPLVVAALTDELDCVALLEFPDELVTAYRLKPGTRLLTLNSYARGEDVATDLVLGPENAGRYCNFRPVIGDFLAADPSQVAERKSEISDQDWKRTVAFGKAAMQRAEGRYRDGRPNESQKSAYQA